MKTSFVVAIGIVVMSFPQGKASETTSSPAGVQAPSAQRCGWLGQKNPVEKIMTELHLNLQAAADFERTLTVECRNERIQKPERDKSRSSPTKFAEARGITRRIPMVRFDAQGASGGSATLPGGGGAASSRRNLCGSYDEFCEQSKEARPTLSVMGGAGGVDHDSYASFGSLVRIPLLPLPGKPNKHGNFGIELGALWSGHKGTKTSLSSTVLDSYSAKPGQLSIGDWTIKDDVDILTKSFTQVEFLGLGYQTPWIAKRLSFEAGMRLAGIAHDPRATTKETVSKSTYQGEVYCNPNVPNSCPETCYTDSFGYTTCTTDYNSHSSEFDVKVLNQKTLSVTAGTLLTGVGGVAYAATNFLITNHFGLKFEADRTLAKGVNAGGYRGGLIFRF